MRALILRNEPAAIARAAAVLRRGGLVVFPTETVYGLGARAFDASAARRVYRAKGRPSDNPLIVHALDDAMVARVAARLTPLARRLMKAFWPGPLTLVLDKSDAVPLAVTAGKTTVAVRRPSHPVARALLRALGEPIAAPSANRSGRPSPTTAAHAARDLGTRVTLILDGGPCAEGLESAIVDARGLRPVLLRPGTIPAAAIAAAAGTPLAAPGRRAPASPGTRHRHYAPACRVILVPPAALRAGAVREAPGRGLIHRSAAGAGFRGWRVRVRGGTAAYAKALFAALRRAEDSGVEELFVETMPESGAGAAVMDRLRRAATATRAASGRGTRSPRRSRSPR